MKRHKSIARRFIAGIFGVALLSPLATSIAFAHEAPCPYCGMKVTQDTATQDNEVALKIGRKRIEYKCVYCALAEAKTEYKGDLSILAPSEKKGEPVTLKREDDKWTAQPEAPYFVTREKLKHKSCQEQARAFTTEEAAKKYIAANKETLGDAKPLTLTEMLKVVGIESGAPAAPPAKANPPKADQHSGHENHQDHAK